MTDFRGYLCWDPAVANGAVNTEAVVASPAVFLATHTPLRIRKAQVRGRSLVLMDGTSDEDAVLRDFLGRKPDTGTLLMPVVGDTGTGKSHLVRWIGNNIPPSDKYCVIYLEKSRTSLKAVVNTLMGGIADADSALAKLKDDIGSLSVGLDEKAMARRLINALNESLAQTTPRDMSGTSRALAGTQGLAAILQDPYIQGYMLGPGKFIPLLSAQLLHDRSGSGQHDRAPGFTVDDLPLEITDPDPAARIAQKVLNLLHTVPGLRNAAVDLLNQHLEAAVQNAYQLGAGRLYAAMLQVREEYARQGKEIILLIEDFALIQGVQRELLDAITEAAIRGGSGRYAPIRTLMAVTTGYFTDLPETAMSRVAAATTGYVYDLDVPFTQGNDGTEEIASFTGRYLNAARIGQDELDREGTGSVSNKCVPCVFRDACHKAFGASAEGYGLYPFNRSALARVVHSAHSLSAGEDEWVFVPRTTLGSVIRPVLIDDAASIHEGTFPAQDFRERFKSALYDHALSTSVAEVVDDHDKLEPERRKLILEFWADSPDDVNDVNPGILQAFALQPLVAGARPGGGRPAGGGRPSRVGSPRPAKAPKPTAGGGTALAAKIQRVEEWGARSSQVLPQEIARDLRGVVADAVARRYPYRSPLMLEPRKPVLDKAWPRDSTVVSIEGAGGQGLAGADTAGIQFSRTAMNSQFFQSLLRAKIDVSTARAEDLRRLANMAEARAPILTAALQRYLQITDAHLITGLRASLLGAALAGKAWPGCDEADLLCAAFDNGSGWVRGDLALRTPQWQQALETHLQSRSLLVDRLRNSTGIAQGTGAVQMLDAARLLPLLREAASQWAWEPQTPPPEWVRPAVIGLSRWESMVDDQLAGLSRHLAEVRQLLPAEVSGIETVEAVRRAMQESDKAGLAPPRDDAARISELLAQASQVNWRVIGELDADFRKISLSSEQGTPSWPARVTAAARDRGGSFETARSFLMASDQWLTAALSSAALRSDPVGDDAAKQVEDLVRDWGGVAVIDQEGAGR